MKGLPHHNRPRSIGAQIARMRGAWPDFEVIRSGKNYAVWHGTLRGFQRAYKVGVYWHTDGDVAQPRVWLISPRLAPREGGTFEEIPHLIFNNADAVRSDLCLYDPEGKEWSSNDLIADTTIPWAASWLRYYELWHYDGKWRGGGVGPESVAEARRAAIHRAPEE